MIPGLDLAKSSSKDRIPYWYLTPAWRLIPPTGIFPLDLNNPQRAAYIEVLAMNVNAFPGVILQAHKARIDAPRMASGLRRLSSICYFPPFSLFFRPDLSHPLHHSQGTLP
jgi:hypothetical protein